jgi:hypothetical protein
MAVKAKKKTTTNRNTTNLNSAATNRMTKGDKGAAGASKPPKTVARPSGGTKTGGGKAAGRKRGC